MCVHPGSDMHIAGRKHRGRSGRCTGIFGNPSRVGDKGQTHEGDLSAGANPRVASRGAPRRATASRKRGEATARRALAHP